MSQMSRNAATIPETDDNRPAPASAGKKIRRSVPWMLLLAVALGIFLRLHQLTLQIPADDEWHALQAASALGFVAIAVDLGGADRCIPLSLFYKLAAETVGLGEALLRLPPLVAGIALLFLPWTLRPALSSGAVAGTGWLLAVSPLLIYFSRYARPYSISLILALLAAFCFYRWWTGGGRLLIVLYVVCAAFGAYFHLSVIFFVLAPLGYASLESLRPGNRHRFRELLLWAGVTAGGMGLLLGPPLILFWERLTSKLSADWINGDTVEVAVQLMAGSRHAWVVVLMAALSLIGAMLLAREHPRAARYAIFLSLAQIAGVLVTGPSALSFPIVLARYCLAIVPLMLLASARAAAAAEDLLRLGQGGLRLPKGSFCALLAIVLLWAGPLGKVDFHPNSWTNHALFNYTYNLLHPRYSYFFPLDPRRLSPFYERLAERPAESLLLLEAPWHSEWHFNHYPQLQFRHRQHMMIGFVNPPDGPIRFGELRPHDERFHFSSFAHLSEYKKIREAGVDYVILHKDLSSEFSGGAPDIDMSAWIARYRRDFGTPEYEDDLIAVFRTRSALRADEPSSKGPNLKE